MSHIRKRGNIYYYYHRPAGILTGFPLGVDNKRLALQLQDELDLKYARKRLGLKHIEKIPLKKFLREFLEDLEFSKSDAWFRRLRIMHNNFARFLSENNVDSLAEINYKLIFRYKKKRKQDITIRQNFVSDKTINEELFYIKSLLKYAVKNEYLDPLRFDVSDLRIKGIEQNKFMPFSDDQIREIFDADLVFKDYYKVLYYTGLRSVDAGTLHSDDFKTDGDISYIEKETKKEKVWVAVPIHENISFITLKKGYIFKNLVEKGQRARPYEHLRRFVKSKNWEGHLTIHSFRHSFNQRLISLNVDQSTRALMIGHSNVDSNKDYSHKDIKVFDKIMKKY